MCGIAGVVAFDQRFSVSPDVLKRMSQCIAHRGPDHEGFCASSVGPHVALIHRRLAILDLDPRSNEPMTDGKHWLVFNGEIYNFRELKNDLSPNIWQTTGDTEVLLNSYARWGEKCPERLNGMFAFAVWDAEKSTLFLARDRMGQKPLYFSVNQDSDGRIAAVAFASEISALLAVPWVSRATSDDALAEYLRWGFVPGPQTIYTAIRQVEPSQAVTVTREDLKARKYFHEDDYSPPTDVEFVRHTRELVCQAVRRQLVSDVPLGCFLSGGIDSSIIAAAMKAAVGKDQPVLTFAIGFDEKEYDETSYAAQVAKHLGTEHRQFIVRPNAVEDLPKLAAVFGQPFADSSALPTHYLSRQTRQHVKVALSGDGGDETFGGYDRYRAMRISSRLGLARFLLPLPVMATVLGKTGSQHPKSTSVRMRRLLESAHLPPAKRYASYMRLFDEPSLRALLLTAPRESIWLERRFRIAAQDRDVVAAASATDRVTYLPDDLLTKLDRCSMLHALEVRSPFLDHDVVCFAAQLSDAQLLNGGGKRLLREAFSADLPSWVFRRRKMGFAVPIGQWLRTTLRPMLHDLLFSRGSFASKTFQPAALERMIQDHQDETQDHSQRLYALLMLELWHRNSLT
jgi:asparagine synthase (glutamine-hydrolysing)